MPPGGTGPSDNINISSNTIVYWYERCVRVLFQTNATVTIIRRCATATRQMRCHRVAHGANEAEEPKGLPKLNLEPAKGSRGPSPIDQAPAFLNRRKVGSFTTIFTYFSEKRAPIHQSTCCTSFFEPAKGRFFYLL